MQIERKDLEKSVIELTVEEKVENLGKLRKTVLKEIEANAEIKGFRKGSSIPEAIIVKEFGEERIASMVIEKAIDKMYRTALKQEKIMPVAQGEITEIVSESPLKIKMQVEVLPTVELDKKYRDIKLKKKKISVTAKEVDGAISEIETKFTKFEEVTDKKSTLEIGDRATIDTQGFDTTGKILENTDMKDYPLVLGGDILVPGFEDQIVGAKLGDELNLDVDFPKDYHNEAFKGMKTKFKVIIKKVEKAKKPEFTPEFIEGLRGKKLDFEGFKALIKEEIRDTKESNARIDEEKELIEALLKNIKMDIGDKMLASQTDRVFEEVKQNMTQGGVKMGDYLKGLNLSEADYKENHLKETSMQRLQGELILAEIVKLEKPEVTDEVMAKEVEKIISGFGAPDVVERLKELYVPGNNYYEELRQRMMYRNIIDSFFA